jgi:hypothetical protein
MIPVFSPSSSSCLFFSNDELVLRERTDEIQVIIIKKKKRSSVDRPRKTKNREKKRISARDHQGLWQKEGGTWWISVEQNVTSRVNMLFMVLGGAHRLVACVDS